MAGTIGDLIVRVGANVDEFYAAMGQMQDRVRGAMSQVEKELRTINRAADGLISAGTAMSAAITVPLVGIGAAALETAGKIEQTEIAFTTMLGSGAKAQQFLNELRSFAAATPFEFPDLVDASKKMMALGFEAEKVIPTLRTIGDAAAALGGGSQTIDRITLALGQMAAKGKVSAQEMNQLAEAGIAGWKILADAAGTSIADIQKKAEKGLIDGVSAQQVILEGLNERFGGAMEQQSKTMLGVWSTLKDKIGFALEDIGKVLLPFAKDAVAAMIPLVGKIKDLAEWFGKLPEPVKTFTVAFGLLAAAAGPVLLGLGGIATALPMITAGLAPIAAAIGISVGAFAAWGIAIAAAGAALVAIGLWINNHWASIKAVVSQAWEGVKEMWGAAWNLISGTVEKAWNAISSAAESVFGPTVSFLRGLWDSLRSAWTSAWNAVASVLHTVWDNIKAAASTVWGSITRTIDGFIEVARKIPGVSKLLNLDETWKSAEQAAKAHQELQDSLSKSGGEMKRTGDAAGGLKFNLEESEKAAKKAAAEIKQAFATLHIKDVQQELADMEKAFVLLYQAGKLSAQQITDALEMIREKQIEVNIATMDTKKMWEDAFDLPTQHLSNLIKKHVEWISESKRVEIAHSEYMKLSRALIDIEAGIDELNPNVRVLAGHFLDAAEAAEKTADAFHTLGIKSSESLRNTAQASRDAYQRIASDARSTTQDIERAWVAMIEDQIAAGEQLPASVHLQYEIMKRHVQQGLSGMQKFWHDFAVAVVDITKQFSQDLISGVWDALFDKNKSVTDAIIDSFKNMGRAFLEEFMRPVEEALAKFIATTIKDLLSGKGFGGIIDGIKGIGSAIGSVFGAGGGAAATAGTVASTGGGVTSGIAGVAGSAVGVGSTAVVGMVAGVASAISSVIGNFQMRAMNQSLDLIEKATRYSEAYLLNLVGQGLVYLPWLESIGRADGPLWTIRADTMWIEDIRDRTVEVREELKAIKLALAGLAFISVAAAATAANTAATAEATKDAQGALERVERESNNIRSGIDRAQTTLATGLANVDYVVTREGERVTRSLETIRGSTERVGLQVQTVAETITREHTNTRSRIDHATTTLQASTNEAANHVTGAVNRSTEAIDRSASTLRTVIEANTTATTEVAKTVAVQAALSAEAIVALMKFSGEVKQVIATMPAMGGFPSTVNGKTFLQMYPGVDLANTTTGFVDTLIGFQNIALKQADEARALGNYTLALHNWVLNAEQRANNNLTFIPPPTRPNVSITVNASTLEAEKIADAVKKVILEQGMA